MMPSVCRRCGEIQNAVGRSDAPRSTKLPINADAPANSCVPLVVGSPMRSINCPMVSSIAACDAAGAFSQTSLRQSVRTRGLSFGFSTHASRRDTSSSSKLEPPNRFAKRSRAFRLSVGCSYGPQVSITVSSAPQSGADCDRAATGNTRIINKAYRAYIINSRYGCVLVPFLNRVRASFCSVAGRTSGCGAKLVEYFLGTVNLSPESLNNSRR